MNLVQICKLLGLEVTGYTRQEPHFLDKYSLVETLKYEWEIQIIDFSHGIFVEVDQKFLHKNGLTGSVPLTIESIGEELDELIWQEASEQFKEKLGKAIEFGGKL